MLPYFQTDNKDLSLMQTRWRSELNPILANPSLLPSIVNVNFPASGTIAIPHLLNRLPAGWRVIDVDGTYTAYRSAPFDSKFLTLTTTTAGATVHAKLEIF